MTHHPIYQVGPTEREHRDRYELELRIENLGTFPRGDDSRYQWRANAECWDWCAPLSLEELWPEIEASILKDSGTWGQVARVVIHTCNWSGTYALLSSLELAAGVPTMMAASRAIKTPHILETVKDATDGQSCGYVCRWFPTDWSPNREERIIETVVDFKRG
ncbi:MAG: hypothetical protein DCF32_00315 [Leptolyngbya sp.]|jgi:hypothetical protein|nr:MAG: hypothetical protein DCF32_00315 [Leptolyngbya sp.]